MYWCWFVLFSKGISSNDNDSSYGNDEDEEEIIEVDDDDDDDDDTHAWLVQKVLPGKLEEVFLMLKER